MTTTKQQVEDLFLELLQHKEYQISKTSSGLQITKGINKYLIASVSTVVTSTQITRR